MIRSTPPLSVGIACHSSRGGSTRIAVELARGLAARGHAPRLLVLHPLAMPFTASGAVGIEIAIPEHAGDGDASRLHAHWSATEQERFLELLTRSHRRAPFDLLHCHYAQPFAAVASSFIRRLAGRRPRVVCTLHGTDVSRFGDGAADATIARSLHDSDALTTVSSVYARLAIRNFGLERTHTVIPNFVDTRLFRPRTSAQPVGERPLRLLHASNFRPVKNIAALVRIFAAVRRLRPAELWLVGDGEDAPAAIATLRRLGLGDSVLHLGFRDDLHRILPQADLLVSTSHEESFCLVALEAMACGVPVVASRVGGLPELVVDGQTGHLYPPGDVDHAVRAIIALAGDPARYHHMSRAARKRAATFDCDAVVPRYEALYRAVLAPAAHTPRARRYTDAPVPP